jgi:hypothetical protein
MLAAAALIVEVTLTGRAFALLWDHAGLTVACLQARGRTREPELAARVQAHRAELAVLLLECR